MRGLVIGLALVALAVWSLFAWGVYALLGFSGELAAGGVFLFPFIPPELIYWTAQLLGGMGGVIVWIVWAIGAAIIGVLALIPLAFLRRRPNRYDRRPDPYEADYPPDRGPDRRYDAPPPRRNLPPP